MYIDFINPFKRSLNLLRCKLNGMKLNREERRGLTDYKRTDIKNKYD